MSRTHKRNDYHKNHLKWENDHHIINECRNWRTTEDNLIKLRIDVHNALHKVFCNETPFEMLYTILEYSKWTLTDELKSDLYAVLEKHKANPYNPYVTHWGKIKNGGLSNNLNR